MTDAPAPPPPSSAPPPPPAAGYGQAAGPALQLSSPGKRFGAWLLEILLIIVTLLIGWLVWSLIVWGKSTTPAKQLLKMRIVRFDENRPATYGEMAMRELVGKYLLGNVTFGISTIVGGVMIISDGTGRQAIWDKIASTTVVEDPNNQFGL